MSATIIADGRMGLTYYAASSDGTRGFSRSSGQGVGREANEIVRFGMVYWIQGQIAPRRQLRRTGTVTPLETILWAGDGFISSAVLICIFRKPKPVVWESANEPSPLGGDSLMA